MTLDTPKMSASSSGISPQLPSSSIDYRVWDDGQETTSVTCLTDTGRTVASVQNDGVFIQYLKLESHSSFSVVQTVTLTEGPLKGYQAIIVNPRPAFRFLDLPREIRDEIYTYAMVPDVEDDSASDCSSGIHNWIRFTSTASCDSITGRDTRTSLKRIIPRTVDSSTPRHHAGHPSSSEDQISSLATKASMTPGLLLVSRGVYEEALLILYGRNAFKFQFPELDLFLSQIGSSNKLIRHLYLEDFVWCGGMTKKRTLLSKLLHLRYLTILNKDRVRGSCVERPILSPLRLANFFYQEASEWIRLVGDLHSDCFAAVTRIDFATESPNSQNTREQSEPENFIKEFRTELKNQIAFRLCTPFPFLRLPRRVRDKVYVFAMEQDHDWQYHCNKPTRPEMGTFIRYDILHKTVVRDLLQYDHNGRFTSSYSEGIRRGDSLTPGFLQVNRKVHNEYRRVLYRDSDLIFEAEGDLWKFLDCVGYSHVYLGSVKLRGFPQNHGLWPKLLHLKTLKLDVSRCGDRVLEQLHFMLHSRLNVQHDTYARHAARIFYNRATGWIEGVQHVHNSQTAPLSIIDPLPDGFATNKEQWMRTFLAELQALIE